MSLISCLSEFTTEQVVGIQEDLNKLGIIDSEVVLDKQSAISYIVAELKSRLLEELNQDPNNVGYIDKSDSEQADLLNTAIQSGEDAFPRWFEIMLGIPYAPNTVTASMISEAKE